MAEADLAATEGQADEAPVEESPTFGFDDTDKPAEAPEAQSGQPEEPQQSTETAEPEDKEQGYLRQQDYTRKTQDLAEERRAFQAEREAWQKEMQSQREQMQQTLQTFQTPQQNDSLTSRLQQIANDPNLSAEDRAGLGVVAQLAQTVEEQQQIISELRGMQDEFQQTRQTVEGLTASQTAAQRRELSSQLDRAVSMFGEDTVREQMAFVRRLGTENGQWRPEINPRTNEPYTIPELVALGSGKQADFVEGAKEAQRNGTRQAKARVAPNGTTAPVQSKPTMESVLAEIAENQRVAQTL